MVSFEFLASFNGVDWSCISMFCKISLQSQLILLTFKYIEKSLSTTLCNMPFYVTLRSCLSCAIIVFTFFLHAFPLLFVNMDSEESSSKATDKAKETTLEKSEKVKGTHNIFHSIVPKMIIGLFWKTLKGDIEESLGD